MLQSANLLRVPSAYVLYVLDTSAARSAAVRGTAGVCYLQIKCHERSAAAAARAGAMRTLDGRSYSE